MRGSFSNDALVAAVSVGLESTPFVAQLGGVAGQGGSTRPPAVIGVITAVIPLGSSVISAGGPPEQLSRIPAAPEEAG